MRMGTITIELYVLLLPLIVTAVSSAMALLLYAKLRRIKCRLNEVSETLTEIAQGEDDRKILAAPDDVTAAICYQINEIVHDFRDQLIELKRAEKMNKQLMTSLSHDVRTPLTTLIGYLDAVNKGIVSGKEREEYIETACLKSHDMKDYINKLFEWFKLNSDEETFVIQKVELAELTRSILQDWLFVFEDSLIEYDITIPETQIMIQFDIDAYSRILNNLIQNVISHSGASRIEISVVAQRTLVDVRVADNGKGISKQDLPHIFDRLYKCDKSRSEKGSGLGLSIVQRLVKKMKGSITAHSEPDKKTEFCLRLPLLEQ